MNGGTRKASHHAVLVHAVRRAAGAASLLAVLALASCQQGGAGLATSYAPHAAPPVRSAATIPFGPPPAPARLAGPATVLSASFEFVETARGYDLNAVVLDRATGSLARTRIDHCRVIDIDAFDESSRSLFATPVLCDGRGYAIDLAGTRLVVLGPGRSRTLRSVPAGRVELNGVAVLAGA